MATLWGCLWSSVPRFQNCLPRAHPRCPLCTPPGGVGQRRRSERLEEALPTHSVLPSFIHSGHRGMNQVLCAGTQVGQSLPSGAGADLGTEVLPAVGSLAGCTRPLAHHNPRLGASRCYTGEGCKGPPHKHPESGQPGKASCRSKV